MKPTINQEQLKQLKLANDRVKVLNKTILTSTTKITNSIIDKPITPFTNDEATQFKQLCDDRDYWIADLIKLEDEIKNTKKVYKSKILNANTLPFENTAEQIEHYKNSLPCWKIDCQHYKDLQEAIKELEEEK